MPQSRLTKEHPERLPPRSHSCAGKVSFLEMKCWVKLTLVWNKTGRGLWHEGLQTSTYVAWPIK